MSGNPFRRTKGARLPEQDDSETVGFGGDAVVAQRNTQAPSKRKKKKKVVTIQTPPHSPEERPRRLSSGRLSPPPPPRIPEDDVEDSDSTATADSDLEQALRNTRRNSGSLPPTASALGQGGAPYNPFARTLATSEAAFGLQTTGGRGNEGPVVEYGGWDGQGQNGTGRPAMNVDQFKNILLTGSAVATPPPEPSTTTSRTARFGDSSSSTTTSSASTYEPYLDVQQETPRTSFDQMDSPSESSDSSDEESSGLMTGTERLDDFAPPAPPKISTRGPQTVSFADFDETITQGARSQSPYGATANDVRRLRPPVLHRQTSDLNKPLPPPPHDPVVEQPSEASLPIATPSQANATAASIDDNADSKKVVPPPPPSARRVGHATNTAHARERSTSSPSRGAEVLSQPKSDDVSQKPPPPPPARKAIPSPQPTIPEPLSMAPIPLPAPSTSTAESKSLPPPPPLRRAASKAGSSVHRASSTASRSSSQQKDYLAPSTSAPLPPPPPRRGGKRESVEARQQAAVPEETITPGTHNDILADMSAFQAEIDALRAKAGGQG